jgi:hypothetical protein
MVKAPIQRDTLAARQPFTGGKPLLRVSEKQKTEKDFAHSKDVIDFFVQSTYFQDSLGQRNSNYRDLYVLYNVYNNIIPEEYFEYVTNPLNSVKTQHRNFPAKIRPYNIIRNNCDLLFGDFDKRPKNYTVWVGDTEAINQAEEQLYSIILSNLEQQFINAVNEQTQDTETTGVPSQPVEPPAKVKAKFYSNYRDERAVWGQANLEEIDHEVHTTEQFARMFKDFVIAGECYSFKRVHKGRIIYERVSPMDIDYDKSPDSRYIEDAAWVVRRKYVLPSDVVSEFYEELTAAKIDKLESQDSSLPFTVPYFNTLFGNTYRREEDLRRAKITQYHVTWKYYRKFGILSYPDPLTGQMQEMEVDENYKPDKALGESVEWFWVPEWWEGYRLDSPNISANPASQQEKNIIYLGIKRVEEQRNQENDFGYCKGLYNGFRFSDVHSRNTSIVELGLPYQIMYIILHYRLELALAKSKGKIALLDINTIPNTKGWDEEKFFYWSEANGFALLNRNQLGVDKGWNQYQVLDLSLFEHIANLIKIMDYVRQEWDQLVGFTPQRKGQTAASETASGIDAARYQSSVISERLFAGFDEFIRTERQGLLDLSKFTNLTGRKAIFYGEDMQAKMLEIDPARYTETTFNVHVSNSSADLEDVKMMKQQAANFAAQGSKPSVIAEILQAKNIAKLKSVLKAMEGEEMEAAEKQQQGEAALEERKIAIQKEYKEIEYTFDSLLQKEKYDEEKDLAHIKGQYQLADTDTPGDSLDPAAMEEQIIKREEMVNKTQTERAKLGLEAEKIKSAERINDKKVQVEKYKADTSLKIAKENKTAAEMKKKAATKKSSKSGK